MQGIDFRVSPDERWIAISYYPYEMVIIDATGQVMATYSYYDLSANKANESQMIIPELWSEDSSSFWGCLSQSVPPNYLFEIQTSDWIVNSYDLTKLIVGVEYAINPSQKMLAYTNGPMILDVYGQEDFDASQKVIHLSLYNLKTKSLQILDTSIAKEFYPKWMDADTLAYDDPNGDERILLKITN